MKFFRSKVNIAFLALLLGGILLMIRYKILYDRAENEITSSLRILGYVSWFVILICTYVLFVRAKQVVLSNLILLLWLVLIVEVFYFNKLGRPAAFKVLYTHPVLPPDHISNNIGSVPFSDTTLSKILVADQDTVYNVNYTIDKHTKRVTPQHSTDRHKHALFFGCSITFGEGVEDDETMPYYFQETSDEYNAYNFALAGHATNHTLARLQYKPLNDQVHEEEGIGLYIFFWGHVDRAIGTMNRYCGWLFNAPYYYLKDGELHRDKMFYNGRRLSRLYEHLYQVNIVKHFGIEFPVRIRKSHLDLITEMIRESKNEYLRQFPKGKFYCVLYPEWESSYDGFSEEFRNLLNEKDIDFIDLTSYVYRSEDTLGKDTHPNPSMHKRTAQMLLDSIAANR